MLLPQNAVAYVIWKDVKDDRISDQTEVVGVFVTDDHEKADDLVRKMNEEDLEVAHELELHGRIYHGYWKQEVTALSLKNCKEYFAQ